MMFMVGAVNATMRKLEVGDGSGWGRQLNDDEGQGGQAEPTVVDFFDYSSDEEEEHCIGWVRISSHHSVGPL